MTGNPQRFRARYRSWVLCIAWYSSEENECCWGYVNQLSLVGSSSHGTKLKFTRVCDWLFLEQKNSSRFVCWWRTIRVLGKHRDTICSNWGICFPFCRCKHANVRTVLWNNLRLSFPANVDILIPTEVFILLSCLCDIIQGVPKSGKHPECFAGRGGGGGWPWGNICSLFYFKNYVTKIMS
jgi:hypothetical protein